MKRLASSLAVGDTVGVADAVVVAIEPLNDDMLRLTLFVDGEAYQQDTHQAVTFDNVKSPPALLEALGALAGLHELIEMNWHTSACEAHRQAVDLLATARRLGIMTRFGGVYSVRK